MTPEERTHARRVFEESLAKVQQQYVTTEDILVEARMEDDTGRTLIVARYKLYMDGRVECFEVLDEVLWPRV
jgi:hypothetical protein